MDIKATVIETDQTFTELTELLESIPDGKMNVIPFEGSWTAGELSQHIVLSAGGSSQLLNGPVRDTDRDPEANCAQINSLFLNFDIKFKSPESIVPEAKIYDKQRQTDTLREIQKNLLVAIETLDPTLTCLAFEFPGIGYLTRAEAATFTITHTQRHVHQLKNIMKSLSV